jgi:hypothetical protein
VTEHGDAFRVCEECGKQIEGGHGTGMAAARTAGDLM